MKKVYIGLICSLLFVGMASANTNIDVWVGGDTPTSFVNGDGWMVAPYFVGNGSLLTAVPGTGSTIAPGYFWVGNAQSTAVAIAMSGDATIITNGTITVTKTTGNLTVGAVMTNAGAVKMNSTLAVTGIGTFTATPVLLNGLTVQTNVTVGGTLSVTGTSTFVGATVLAAPAGVGTYTNAAIGFTNVFDVGGRLVSHNP